MTTKLLLILTVVLLNTVLPAISAKQCNEYYWRDYFFGEIPEDALPVVCEGKDVTYIGSSYIQNYELLVTQIFPAKGCRPAFARASAYDKDLNTTTNTRILCGKSKEKFVWKHIRSEDLFDEIRSTMVIPGGSEVGQKIYIGKVFLNNEVIIGKVFRDNQSNKGFWARGIDSNGRFKPNWNSLEYDILTYDCNHPKSDRINPCSN